ncbi:hypothetical protein IFO70_14620 [Phormidium tenue FACHB-886]|nr:hypothetical protein [Phormidium tenue FACHB-886]
MSCTCPDAPVYTYSEDFDLILIQSSLNPGILGAFRLTLATPHTSPASFEGFAKINLRTMATSPGNS